MNFSWIPNSLLNVLLLLAFLLRCVWWSSKSEGDPPSPTTTLSTTRTTPLSTTEDSQEREIGGVDLERRWMLVRNALARGNASVFAALLADAAARRVQHRYLQTAFLAPS